MAATGLWWFGSLTSVGIAERDADQREEVCYQIGLESEIERRVTGSGGCEVMCMSCDCHMLTIPGKERG